MQTDVKRPLLRYHGGKWKLSPWIISHFPQHRIYVEPFGGGASVLLRKERAYAEIYNDLDGEIVNVFKVLRDNGEDLIRLVTLTPFSREEFDLSYDYCDDPIEKARRTLVRCGMGFGSSAINTKQKTGFRGSATRSGTHPGSDWGNQPNNLSKIVDRLTGIIVENRPAIDVMKYHDGHNTLHYIDPPYLHEARTYLNGKGAYRYEMKDQDHIDLSKFVRQLKGMVIISGYGSELYSEIYKGWQCIERKAYADCAKPRIECLWISPNAIVQPRLFGGEYE